MSATSILVVEDEAIIADDLERTLKRLGYAVPAVVAEGDRAVDAASRCTPSLVLMDIKLRGAVDGVSAARSIRDRFEIPVVFLTSYSDAATLSRASAARPYGYVLKPFVERDLRVAVELALHKHEIEQTLRTRERWFSTTLHSVGDGVVATDEKLDVTFMNRVAEELTGYSMAEALGRPIGEVCRLVGAHGEAVDGPAALALSTREVSHLPAAARLARRKGAPVLVDDSAAPITDPAGRVLGVVMVFRDVSERADLELRVARSERLASLGTLAAGLCHEINNPLACVVAGVGYALETFDDPGAAHDRRESLQDAYSAATRIGKIVRDIRAFAQPVDDARVETDLRDVLESALKFTDYVVKHRARCELRLSPAPRVHVDPTRIAQVFVNLLVNAAQATPEGQADQHTITVTLGSDDAGNAVVEVCDDGEGIAPEALPRVFDPFYTTKAPGGGMGLGLSISHSIVESFGGTISVQSSLGEGTTFRVRLPPAARSEKVTGLVRTTPPTQTTRGRVLVIDDEESVARALVRALSTMHDVETCNDGRAALAKLLGPASYDAILCDVTMPNMTGLELYEALCASRPDLASRVAFLTGGVTVDTVRDAIEASGRPVIYKPFTNLSELRARVNELVARSVSEPLH